MMMDVKTIKLSEHYGRLNDKQVQSITFVDSYFQIHFVHGGMSCISETLINTVRGNFVVPSKDGNWEIVQLIGKNILSAEEKANEIILKVEDGTEIIVNTRLGPPGDTFHITVEDLPTLHF